MNKFLALGAVLFLGSCGGGGGGASGVVGRACMEGGRSAANARLCGCIQGVASQTLSRGEQSRVAGWFADPDEAQAWRTRDDAGSEAFWRRYRDFAEQSERLCR